MSPGPPAPRSPDGRRACWGEEEEGADAPQPLGRWGAPQAPPKAPAVAGATPRPPCRGTSRPRGISHRLGGIFVPGAGASPVFLMDELTLNASLPCSGPAAWHGAVLDPSCLRGWIPPFRTSVGDSARSARCFPLIPGAALGSVPSSQLPAEARGWDGMGQDGTGQDGVAGLQQQTGTGSRQTMPRAQRCLSSQLSAFLTRLQKTVSAAGCRDNNLPPLALAVGREL